MAEKTKFTPEQIEALESFVDRLKQGAEHAFPNSSKSSASSSMSATKRALRECGIHMERYSKDGALKASANGKQNSHKMLSKNAEERAEFKAWKLAQQQAASQSEVSAS